MSHAIDSQSLLSPQRRKVQELADTLLQEQAHLALLEKVVASLPPTLPLPVTFAHPGGYQADAKLVLALSYRHQVADMLAALPPVPVVKVKDKHASFRPKERQGALGAHAVVQDVAPVTFSASAVPKGITATFEWWTRLGDLLVAIVLEDPSVTATWAKTPLPHWTFFGIPSGKGILWSGADAQGAEVSTYWESEEAMRQFLETYGTVCNPRVAAR